MKKLIGILSFTILSLFLHGIWSGQRVSSLLPTNEVLFRTEILEMDGAANEVLFVSELSVQRQPMIFIEDYTDTWEGLLPIDSFGLNLIGFRTETEEQNYIMPVFRESEELNFNGMTLASVDATNDSNFPNPNLEIIADYVSFNDEQLIFGIQNTNGLYPTNESFTFFAYLAALINPQGNEDDIVYALMHTVNQPGIIEPGLYKIFGTGMDNLEKIAEIEMEIDEETLILACDWQPLLNDSDFMSWFDPVNPVFAFMSITQKITLTGGVQDADEGKSCLIFPAKNEIAILENTTPQISNLTEIELENVFYLQVDYHDSEENFPVLAQIEFDNGQIRSFYPQSVDYSETVYYRTDDISDIVYLDDWSQAIIRFSDDNVNVAELIYPQTSTNQANLSEHPFFVYPNPVGMNTQGQMTISFQRKSDSPAAISIYNLKGQRVRSYSASQMKSNSVSWNLQDEAGKKVGTGLYLIRFQQNEKQAVQKVIILP